MGILGHPGFDGDERLPWPDWLRAVVLTVSVALVTLLAFVIVNRVTAKDSLPVETQSWDSADYPAWYREGE